MRGEIPYSCSHASEIKKAGTKAKAFFICQFPYRYAHSLHQSALCHMLQGICR